MLRVEALRVSFGNFLAVSRAHLAVGEGEIVAVIGPNGAGKTTLFNAITGQLKLDGGRITFKNEDITGLPPHVISRKGMSRSYQVVNIFPRLTVFENVQAAVLMHHGKSYNLFAPARSLLIEETMTVLESVGLSGKAEHVSGVLSHGDQKVLEMAIALSNEPRMLILDEPTAGMSPEETAVMIRLIKRLSAEMGLTILFCEHDMGLVFSIAQSIMVMSHGRTILQGDPAEVRKNEEVQKAYLGGAK
jgi:branched-chain amino acid transport system ATP-binding protein